MRKPEGTPPLEHARRVAETSPALASALERIARLYYEARFGGRELSSAERAEGVALARLVRAKVRELRPGHG
jgi:hypothetical protein